MLLTVLNSIQLNFKGNTGGGPGPVRVFPGFSAAFCVSSSVRYTMSSKFASVIEVHIPLLTADWPQRCQHWKVGILFSQLFKCNIFEDRGTVL